MSESPRSSIRITHVRLLNWKNFQNVDAPLQRRVFLMGPNASGKSNLLDVFRFLHDIVAVGGGFQAAVERRNGVSRIRCLAARRNPDVSVQVRIGANGEPARWEYELSFSQDKRQQPIIKSEVVRRDGLEVLRRPRPEDERDPERLQQTHLEQVNVNREFRELAEFCGSVRYLHLVPQLVREPGRYAGKVRDPFGSDFLEQVATAAERTRAARLRRIGDALRVAVPQLQELEFFRDQNKGTPHLRGRYEHWRRSGAWQTEEAFSDGTLRLLGLLWVLQDGAGPLLLEEPELSLHSEVVRYLPRMIARLQARTGRQVLLSTHSQDMLWDEGIGLDEVLLMLPTKEGTRIATAGSFREVRALLEGGVPLAEIVIPRTRPDRPEQLLLFGS